MNRKSISRSGLPTFRVLIGLFAFLCGLSLAVFTMATPPNRAAGGESNVEAQTFARVTANGMATENLLAQTRAAVATALHRRAVVSNIPKAPQHPPSRGFGVAGSEATTTFAIPERHTLGPLGNTLWQVDDPDAIADGVAIDANDVWGAWTLQGARLAAYPIAGNGTPDFEFSSFGNGNSGVASAKGADRVAFMESNAAGTDFRLHGFTSTSDGTPDWSFPFPVSDPNLPASSKKVAVSYDGSTVAAVVSDSVTQNSTLYVFEADTGAIRSTWTDPLRMAAVDLTDDGSVALVTQDNLAVLVDTRNGSSLFSVAGSGAGNIFYRISGDGNVLVTSGFDLDVYKFDGTTYQRVIHFTQANNWFGGASIVSRDGSTVGSFAGNFANNWLSGEVFLFDADSAQMIGSYPVSGSGSFQGTPVGAESNDNGTVMAFASWGTEFHDWPEVMVFNRSVELIDQINFPGSAFGVDLSADGQYVAGGSKAVHANQFGSGGRIELIQVKSQPTPTPTVTPSPSPSPSPTPTPISTPTPTATPRVSPRPRPTPHPRPTPP